MLVKICSKLGGVVSKGGGGSWFVFYGILIFSTFRLFHLLLGCQTDRFNWIYWIFSSFGLFDIGGGEDAKTGRGEKSIERVLGLILKTPHLST